jgi:hypothetical protein
MSDGFNVPAPPAPAKLVAWSVFRRPDGRGPPVEAKLEYDLPPTSFGVVQIGTIQFAIRRVARHLALWAGFPVPLSAEVTGVSGLGFHYNSPETFLTSSQRWEIPDEIQGIYAHADRLLRTVSSESVLGVAIENIGASALDEDPDLRYLHAWNGIELLAKASYLLENPEADVPDADGQRGRLPRNSKLIPRLLETHHPGLRAPDLDWTEHLRNGAAHGGLSDYPGRNFEEYVERWDKSEALRDLARETLVNFLAARDILPKDWAGSPARVMIWSTGMVEPVDESAALQRRGISHFELPREHGNATGEGGEGGKSG